MRIQIPYTKKIFISDNKSLNYDKDFLLKRSDTFYYRRTIQLESQQISLICFQENVNNPQDKHYSIIGKINNSNWNFVKSTPTNDLRFVKEHAMNLIEDLIINDQEFKKTKELITKR